MEGQMDPNIGMMDPNQPQAAPGGPVIGGMALNLNVLKEPRGMIRLIQVLFAIFAFASTTTFDTESILQITCPGPKPDSKELYKSTIKYPIEYPFKFGDKVISERYNCSKNIPIIQQKFPMDFSSSAHFFVFTGVLATIFSVAALGFYLTKNDKYITNPLVPVVDLGVTGLLTLFWIAGSCAWFMGVSDLKHYTKPKYLKDHIYICKDLSADCSTVDLGNWATLNISLLFGFANAFLWAMSCWFVFKETSFHQKNIPQPLGNQFPPGYEPTQFPGHGVAQPFPQQPFQQQQQY